jgi:pimeloyl-ACP methyl ester carboxylesterase
MRRPSSLNILLLGAVVLSSAACGGADQPDPPPGSTHVTITTSDGERLDAIELGQGKDVAILSHGATGTKEDFYSLASGFANAGWRVIAYDARGVGDSTGTEGANREEDLRAVVTHARSTDARSVLVAGGSLGASLSLAMARELKADAVVSLSAPAEAYGALDAAGHIGGTIPVFVAAAADNAPYAGDARTIAAALGVTPTIVSGTGHGTGMFIDHPDLIGTIVSWADRMLGHQPAAA